jgi:hypothetical protein
MKHYFLLFILLLVIITIEGCTEELHPETNGTNSPVLNEGELTKAVLDLSVNTFAVEAQAETRAIYLRMRLRKKKRYTIFGCFSMMQLRKNC